MYRLALCAVCCLLLLPAWASEPGEPEPALDVLTPEYWQGRSEQDVLEAFGEPKKTRSDGKGGVILSYKIVFRGEYESATGTTVIKMDTSDLIHATGSASFDLPTGGWGARLLGKQKAKFHINSDGYVYLADISPAKWKRHR